MQDLVGIGVSDPAEEPGVGQGAFQGVALSFQGRPESGQIRFEHLETAGDRGSPAPRPPRTRWSEARFLLPASVSSRVPSGKSNAASPTFPGTLAPAGLPPEPARDHQVQDEKKVVLQLQHDSLAQARDAPDPLSVRFPEGRIEGAHEERAAHPDAVQPVNPTPGARGARCRS